MIRNYFITALRNFTRQKGFSFINVFGLAVGLASAILIYLYIFDELSYDTMHPYSERVYRIGHDRTWQGGEQEKLAYVPSGWGNEMKTQIPEVEESSKYWWFGYPASVHFEENDKILMTEKLLWVEDTYSNLFYFDMEKGNREKVFSQPNSIAINSSTAKRLFGDIDPVGKTVTISHPALQGATLSAIVGGIYKDYPSNTHLDPDYLVNVNILKTVFTQNFEGFYHSWGNGWTSTYIRTTEGADIDQISSSFNKMLESNLGENAVNYAPFFRKITDIHFDSEVQWVTEGAGDMNYIFIFGSIAILILLIAGINYMNLATAKASKRAKEIALRKTLGGSRKQLISQFLGESMLTTVISAGLALGLIALFLPLFNQLAQKAFTFASLFNPVIIVSLLGIVVLVGLISGTYPAIFLSKFMPIEVLRGTFIKGKGSEFFRKTLVVFQFSISIFLLIATVVFVQQMNYIRNSKLSSGGEQIVSIRYGGFADEAKYPAFKAEVSKDPNISFVTVANHLPRQDYFGSITNLFRFPTINGNDYEWSLLNVGYDFDKAFDLEVISGRGFQESDKDNYNHFLINEAGLAALDKTADEIIGLSLSQVGQDTAFSGQIVGVVKDFPYRSVHQSIGPLLITTRPNSLDKIVYAKLPSDQVSEKLAYLEESWKTVFPNIGFDYWFLSDEFGRMYVGEERMMSLTRVFSILAIIVACLGVFGLSSYLAERRMKEIGIRKVLGASVKDILKLLSGTFVLMLIISTVIAVPVAYALMNGWLQNFIYHIDLSVWIFIASLGLVFLLTLFTISFETIKAATLNPAEFIRNE